MSVALALAFLAAVVAGMAQATQGVFNAAVARSLGPLVSALVSMSVAALALLVVILARAVPPPSWRSLMGLAPYPLLVGGLLGATNEMARGALKSHLPESQSAAVDAYEFYPIADLEKSAREDVEYFRNHELMLKSVNVTGWILDIDTGEVKKVVD